MLFDIFIKIIFTIILLFTGIAFFIAFLSNPIGIILLAIFTIFFYPKLMGKDIDE